MPKVNPKDMKPQVYKDPRPAEHFQPVPRSARTRAGWIYDFVRAILTIPTHPLLPGACDRGRERPRQPAR